MIVENNIPKDEFALDTTGEFLQVGKQHGKKAPQRMEEEPWMVLFYRNAFYLYEHREAILSDSRMFLTPLPFRNNLAYTGTSGMRNATLGVYLEWWEACKKAVLKDDDGEVYALTYFLAGSPLSGSNKCSAVTRDGRTETVSFSPFIDLWRTFIEINSRYTEAKQRCQAYTLEETLAELKRQDQEKSDEK